MAKFVWIDVESGGRVPVNPDHVQYLRRTKDGATALVFGAVSGGLHELVSVQPAVDVVRLLEERDDGLEAPGKRQTQARSRAPKADKPPLQRLTL